VTSLGLPHAFTALTYNARLWGATGLAGDRPTRLYFKDRERVDRIADRLLDRNPDLIGLQEVFCPEVQNRLIERLRCQYPYYVRSPAYDGVEESIRTVRRLWPRFGGLYARNIQKVVDGFVLSHYSRESWKTRLARRLVSEDAALCFLHAVTGNPFFWGAGLLFFSKDPVRDHAFIRHPRRADLERFADKGTLKVTTDRATVLLTHIQEGETREARAARGLQLGMVQELMKDGGERVVVLADMNVREGDPEAYHDLAATILVAGGLDAFRAAYPDPKQSPGYTYRVGNKFERKLLGESHAFAGEDQRLDYIFARGLRVLEAGVPEEEFSGLSDHSPVWARFG
jgi:endonuclease/exonuclease/phosphatase family metal-dependent hydrolase